MDTYKYKWTSLQQAIFRLLCIKAGSLLNQREIARLLRISPTAIGKAIKKLEKENIIKKEKRGKIRVINIELNRDNKKILGFKRADNLKQLYEYGVIEYLEDIFPTATIIIFGSYSKGDDTITSDIDIAIIGSKERKLSLENFQNILEREIQINYYNSLHEIHKNLRENVINGIVVAGGISIWKVSKNT